MKYGHSASAADACSRCSKVGLDRRCCTSDWQLRSVHLLGLPIPRALRGKLVLRSGVRADRYHIQVDVRLPWLGQLIACNGWLEALSRGH